MCVWERESYRCTLLLLSATLCARACTTECTGVCLPECRQRETTNVYLPATSPFRAEAAESSAAPRSLRTSCSFLLAAMKSNQSAAVSPGLTSAFNYRTQQRGGAQGKTASAGPQPQHVPAPDAGTGGRRPAPASNHNSVTLWDGTGRHYVQEDAAASHI